MSVFRGYMDAHNVCVLAARPLLLPGDERCCVYAKDV